MEEPKVPPGIAHIMIALAVVFDLTNIGLTIVTVGALGWSIDSFAGLLFTTWLLSYGVHLWSGSLRNVGYSFLAALIAAVPFGALLFPWTIRILHAVKERKPVVLAPIRRVAPIWRL